MTDDAFLKPHLVGARFNGAVIPLEVLADFAGLNELLIETAKWQFRQAHPERKRSPRGFAKSLQLKLSGIEDGSAKPVIQLFSAVATLFPASMTAPAHAPADYTLYMQQARDLVIDTIDAAATGKQPQLPAHLLAHFERFGRSLQDGEAIGFRDAANGQPTVRLDKPTRRKLLLASPDAVDVTDSASVVGMIPDVKQSDRTFQVELPDGRLITAPLTRPHRKMIIEAFDGYAVRQRVLIDGICRFDRKNRLTGIESIDAVTPLDPLDIGVQLDDLLSLKPGWFDGEGPAFPAAPIARLEELFYDNYPAELVPPHLYPTPEGFVRAAWTLAPYEASLEIDLSNYSAYWHVLNLDNGVDEAFDLNLAEAADWTRLADAIRKLPGGHS